MLPKLLLVFILIYVNKPSASCQVPTRYFDPDSISENYLSELKKEYGRYKKYPSRYEKQILIALSYYPELKQTPVIFRIRRRHTTAFTRATWAGLFEVPGKRHFVITLSRKSERLLDPLLFKNLPFNAQIGVIGHELAHVTDFASMTTMQILHHAIKNISRSYIDRFEYNTDAICIMHGLGYQLLTWSSFVREKMNRQNWSGPDYAHRILTKERYMNPTTILEKMKQLAIYQPL